MRVARPLHAARCPLLRVDLTRRRAVHSCSSPARRGLVCCSVGDELGTPEAGCAHQVADEAHVNPFGQTFAGSSSQRSAAPLRGPSVQVGTSKSGTSKGDLVD